ncbi:RraA family protein [Hydrogenophaga sp. BPS33]|uniref:RraA family protein n=1 Tax=Hydrogenophaga sp. BPS33 TaxID=2651974 RepID=UPI00131FFBB2|nr:RraA family protein [Hydrogenophaga sp. BPS33]QHE87858.1 RraA family protein [Hydrogenophaga sp. BPS33]
MPSEAAAVAALVALLTQASAGAAYEAAGQSGALAPEIRSLVPDTLCVGTAFTVQTPSGACNAIVEAVDQAPPGSVIVIDAGETGTACTWGGTAASIAQRRGIAGIVSSAYVRDVVALRADRFPVFARGTVAHGWKRGCGGTSGVPVCIGGQWIHPGDALCADDDGVVVIPRATAANALLALRARLAFEHETERMLANGGSYAQVMQAKAHLASRLPPVTQTPRHRGDSI